MSYKTTYSKVYLRKPNKKQVAIYYHFPTVVYVKFNKSREIARYNRQWKARVKKALCDDLNDTLIDNLEGLVRSPLGVLPVHVRASVSSVNWGV